MSEASDEVVAAEECRVSAYDHGGHVDPMQAAIVHALLAIRAELRTANLLAVAAADGIPITADGWDDVAAHDFPEGTAIRAEIREELDLDDRETR